MASPHFHYLVIGGGSGGISSARRAAGYGAKVAVAEAKRWGGTCVNVGCVPKKFMWCAANLASALRNDAPQYGFGVPSYTLDWGEMKRRRDQYILRLNSIYTRNLNSSDVTQYEAVGSLLGRDAEGRLRVWLVPKVGEELVVTCDHVLLAVGGAPDKLGIPGDEHCITSDDFFELNELPRKIAVVGAGYIAVELACMLEALGSDVTLVIRGDRPLRHFEEMLGNRLKSEMEKNGIRVMSKAQPARVSKNGEGSLTLELQDGRSVDDCSHVLVAVGRSPEIDRLGLDTLGVRTSEKRRFIEVDEFQDTNVEGVHAVGDVAGKVELTPMAIAAGRRLADRLFGGFKTAKADYENVPTVIFSHPPCGTVGKSEKEAREIYGDDKIKVYNTQFTNLYYAPFEGCEKPATEMKLVVLLPEEKVVGLHVIGMGADEMMQGFAVAMKMGATKADLDKCVAIHPTAAEDLVTLAPWGMSPESMCN